MSSTTRLREEWLDQIVGPAPVEAVVGRAGARRRRTRVVVAAISAVAAVLVGVTWSLGGGPREEVVADPSTADNPSGLPWIADGRLHLGSVTVAVPYVEGLVQVGSGPGYGAAYTTDQGDLVLVDAGGTRRTIANGLFSVRVAASVDTPPDHSMIAYFDPGSHDDPDDDAMVLWSTATGAEVARTRVTHRGVRWNTLDEGPFPLAINDGTVTFVGQDGDFTWRAGQAPELIGTASTTDDGEPLQDSTSGHLLYSPREGDVVTTADAATTVSLPAAGGRLTRDGRYVVGAIRLADLDGRGGPAPNRDTAYDAVTGEDIALALDLAPTAAVLSSAAGPGDAVTFFVGAGPRTPSPVGGTLPFPYPTYSRIDLVTCELPSGVCHTSVADAADGAHAQGDIKLPNAY